MLQPHIDSTKLFPDPHRTPLEGFGFISRSLRPSTTHLSSIYSTLARIKLSLFVRPLSGTMLSVQVSFTKYVASFKEKIHTSIGITLNLLQLLFEDGKLQEYHLLYDYDLGHNTVISLALRMIRGDKDHFCPSSSQSHPTNDTPKHYSLKYFIKPRPTSSIPKDIYGITFIMEHSKESPTLDIIDP